MAAARVRPVQCVVSPGGAASVRLTSLPDRLARQRSLAGWPRLVAQEAIHAFMHEPLLPTPDDRLRQAGAAHDLHRPAVLGGRQDDFRPPHDLRGRVTIRDEREEPFPVSSAHIDAYVLSHTESMTDLPDQRNCPSVTEH